MNRVVALAVAFAVASCFSSHDGQQRITGDDCYTCHRPDYEQTTSAPTSATVPPHAESGFPTDCGDCHSKTAWQPALSGLHPVPSTFVNAAGKNETFLLASSPHAGIKCLDCHDLALGTIAFGQPPPSRGFNSDCIQCHPDDSAQRVAHPAGTVSPIDMTTPYVYESSVPNFCRSCHPDGLASAHPDQIFPRTGPHSMPCGRCHIRADGPDTGGMNTNCIQAGCHENLDGHHREEPRYSTLKSSPPPGRTTKNFCLDSRCHPNGRN